MPPGKTCKDLEKRDFDFLVFFYIFLHNHYISYCKLTLQFLLFVCRSKFISTLDYRGPIILPVEKAATLYMIIQVIFLCRKVYILILQANS
jgi:hypothetical protein